MLNLDRERIIDLYINQNLDGYTVAKIIGCSKSTLYRYMLENNIKKTSENKLKQRERNCLSQYGVTNISQLESIKLKKRDTMYKNFGDANYLYSDACKNKIHSTNMERYGVKNPMQNKKVSEKSRLSNLQKLGYRTIEEYENIQNEKRQILYKKYGKYKNRPIETKIYRNLMKDGMLTVYGVEHPLQNSLIQQKFKSTMLKKYGVEYASQRPEFSTQMKRKGLLRYYKNKGILDTDAIRMIELFFDDDYIRDYLKSHSILEMFEFFGIDKRQLISRLKSLNIVYPQKITPIIRSSGEKKCAKILEELQIVFIKEKSFSECRDINPLLFDFYLPEFNCCIEYDGIQHFEPIEKFGGIEYFKTIQHHDEIKNKYCEETGIRLLRITYKEKDIKMCIKQFLGI